MILTQSHEGLHVSSVQELIVFKVLFFLRNNKNKIAHFKKLNKFLFRNEELFIA